MGFEEFILLLDAEIKDGVRAEVALRRIVTVMAGSIREQKRRIVTATDEDGGATTE